MWIVHTYLALVAVSVAVTFTWIVRGVLADMELLHALDRRGPAVQRRAA